MTAADDMRSWEEIRKSQPWLYWAVGLIFAIMALGGLLHLVGIIQWGHANCPSGFIRAGDGKCYPHIVRH